MVIFVIAMLVYQRVYQNYVWNIYWLVVSTPLKNISQWEGLSHILWNITKFETTSQYIIYLRYMRYEIYQIVRTCWKMDWCIKWRENENINSLQHLRIKWFGNPFIKPLTMAWVLRYAPEVRNETVQHPSSQARPHWPVGPSQIRGHFEDAQAALHTTRTLW